MLDLGAGHGGAARQLEAAGATVAAIDLNRELLAGGERPSNPLVGDATRMPWREGSVDGVYTANLLEHVPDPWRLLDEVARVVRSGGWFHLTWTNWWSPWGGHDMTPWHLLGSRLGPRVYERLFGPPPTNRFGEGLYYTHIGRTLRYLRNHPDLEVLEVRPRYWPGQRWIVRVPVLRELVTWNCTVVLRRR